MLVAPALAHDRLVIAAEGPVPVAALGKAFRVAAVFRLELAIPREAGGVQRAGGDGGLHAAARLLFVAAVRESTVARMVGDVGEHLVERRSHVRQPELAQAGRVDQPAARR